MSTPADYDESSWQHYIGRILAKDPASGLDCDVLHALAGGEANEVRRAAIGAYNRYWQDTQKGRHAAALAAVRNARV
jgi:hypothetical protein